MREHGSKAVKKYVRLTPGVDVRDWPEKEDTVRLAFKSIMKQKPKATQLSALPWLSFYTSRDKDGQFNDKFAKERNLFTHIGCLFGHMFQWQLRRTRRRPRASCWNRTRSPKPPSRFHSETWEAW